MAERELFPANNKPEETTTLEKKERPHAKPVAKRVEVKETVWKKFKSDFLAEDVGDIGDYLVKELIIPTIKDTFMNFLAAALWGDRRGGTVYRDSRGQRRTDYNGISRTARVGSDREERSNSRRDRENYSEGRPDFDLDNIVFSTREEADIVLTRMEDYMDDYGQVTVGYLMELMDESCPYTAEYYGWRNLDRASIRRVRNGHQLMLPRPVRLER